MKRRYIFVIVLWLLTQVLYAQNTISIGKTMYQNQAFTAKDKQIFDSDWEGLRVWRWSKAQKYCQKLKLDDYDGWRVASQKEIQAIMTKKPTGKGLFVKSKFVSTMPAVGGKYDDVWMWTRDSKSSKVGAFVNFKKAKSGWADKKYKGYVICTRSVKNSDSSRLCESRTKQESSHSRGWLWSQDTCSGDIALKEDGSLWQFGKVGGCSWGQIIPIDPRTGKAEMKIERSYYLDPKKLGDGFSGAKIINGGYRVYAIKKDGTLWGWGEGLGKKPKKLDSSHNWSDFSIKYEGNGCCGYDVGLKKDGTLWRFPESFGYKSALKLKKISRYNDWKKIVLGCCAIYGLRKDGSLWKSYEEEGKTIFKRYKLKKKSYDGDMELYSMLKSKMKKVPSGQIYSETSSNKFKNKAKKGSILCLSPKEKL